jgi:hypothetical protein
MFWDDVEICREESWSMSLQPGGVMTHEGVCSIMVMV